MQSMSFPGYEILDSDSTLKNQMGVAPLRARHLDTGTLAEVLFLSDPFAFPHSPADSARSAANSHLTAPDATVSGQTDAGSQQNAEVAREAKRRWRQTVVSWNSILRKLC